MEGSTTTKSIKGIVSENGEEMTVGNVGLNDFIYQQLKNFNEKKVKVKLTLEIEQE